MMSLKFALFENLCLSCHFAKLRVRRVQITNLKEVVSKEFTYKSSSFFLKENNIESIIISDEFYQIGDQT